jgi:hypothetical protein
MASAFAVRQMPSFERSAGVRIRSARNSGSAAGDFKGVVVATRRVLKFLSDRRENCYHPVHTSAPRDDPGGTP